MAKETTKMILQSMVALSASAGLWLVAEMQYVHLKKTYSF
jgi:hypothetical protein